MAALKAIILGLVQGLTEFLPISSSGHLVLGQHLFGLETPEILFDVLLHLGTLVAVLIVFRREVLDILAELVKLPGRITSRHALAAAWREEPIFRLMVLIIIGSVPTAALGFSLKELFEALFGSTLAVGAALLATGTVLFLTKLVKPEGRAISGFRVIDALAIGLAQGLAIAPGLSRSGLTISAGLFLGLDRQLAARYSFLLSLPAILGALGLEALSAGPGAFGSFEIGAGFLAALAGGLLALIVLLELVRRGRLHYFAYYCWPAGLVVLGWRLWAG